MQRVDERVGEEREWLVKRALLCEWGSRSRKRRSFEPMGWVEIKPHTYREGNKLLGLCEVLDHLQGLCGLKGES